MLEIVSRKKTVKLESLSSVATMKLDVGRTRRR